MLPGTPSRAESHPLEQKLTHFDNIVVGSGIAGLAATWEIAKLNKPVLLISDRKMDFIRPQLIRLTEVVNNYLVKMLVENNESSDVTITKLKCASMAIKDIERFIYARLEKFKKNIRLLPLSKITDIKLQLGQITIKSNLGDDKQTFSFNNLIAADGVHHETGNILVKNETDTPYQFSNHQVSFRYESLYQEEDNRNGVLYGFISRKDGRILTVPDIDTLIVVNNNDKTNESFSYILLNRESYIKSNHTIMKFTIAGKIPKTILDNNSLKKYFCQLALQSFQEKGIHLKNNDLNIDVTPKSKKWDSTKDQLKIGLFKLKIDAVSHCIFSKNNKRFISIGGAALSPNYLTGIGIENALTQAYLLGVMIKENFSQKSISEFNVEFNNQIKMAKL